MCDLHGTIVWFRKFINAAPIYGANVLVLGAEVNWWFRYGRATADEHEPAGTA